MRTITLYLIIITLLNAALAQAHSIKITHCLKGICPTGVGEKNVTAAHEVFAVSSNPNTKLADWIAYKPTREIAGTTTDLKRNWKKDPLLPPEATLEPRSGGDDYKGAYATLGVERGHLAPLLLFADLEYRGTTNYYSNIAPMTRSLNRGPWKKLEQQEREVVHDARSLYVLTGPIYGAKMSCVPLNRDEGCLPNADEDHQIPIAYWKVIISKTGSSSTAFIMPQDTPSDSSHCSYIRSTEEVENLTGLTLLPALTKPAQRHLNEELGCPTSTIKAITEDADLL